MARYQLLRDKPGRRRLLRVTVPDPDRADLFVKLLQARRPGRRWRQWLNRTLGVDAGRREWGALVRLTRHGVRVPTPRAFGTAPDGAALVAMDFLEGPTLAESLASAGARKNRLLEAVGDLVAALHAAGWVHRDLHAGNFLVTSRGPVLIDHQAALPLRADFARRRDLGELDDSLWRKLSLAQRVRLRARALSLDRPFGREARRRLRAVAAASRARGLARGASRRRRALRPGRAFAALHWNGARGLRRRETDEARILEALRAHRSGGSPSGPAPCLRVRELPAGGVLRRKLRGSPARRAWLAAIGLEALGVPAARPVAFLEPSAPGTRCWLVLEESSTPTALEAADHEPPAALAAALARLALQLHGRGVDAGHLDARRIRLERRGPRLEAWLDDLSGVRFPRAIPEDSRRQALARLEDSLPALPAAARRELLLRYRLFESSREAPLSRPTA